MSESDLTKQEIERHRRKLYGEIEQERAKQDEKWGGPKHDDGLASPDWNAILTRQQGRLAQAMEDCDWDSYRYQLVRVAAVSVAAIESYDRWAANVPVTGELSDGREAGDLMTKEEREKARERCEAATDGPWKWDITKEEVGGGGGLVAAHLRRRDGKLIAHARTDLPRALDTIDALEACAERQAELLDKLVGYVRDYVGESDLAAHLHHAVHGEGDRVHTAVDIEMTDDEMREGAVEWMLGFADFVDDGVTSMVEACSDTIDTLHEAGIYPDVDDLAKTVRELVEQLTHQTRQRETMQDALDEAHDKVHALAERVEGLEAEAERLNSLAVSEYARGLEEGIIDGAREGISEGRDEVLTLVKERYGAEARTALRRVLAARDERRGGE